MSVSNLLRPNECNLYGNSLVLNLEPNINPINENLGAQCVSAKAVTLVAGSWQQVISNAGGPGPIQSGKLTRVWLATINMNLSQVYFAIVFDGAIVPQFGLMPAIPSITNGALSLDILFGNGFGNMTTYATDRSAMTYTNGSNFQGAYIAIDMPFNLTFQIYLFNNNAIIANQNYWIQAFYDYNPTIMGKYLYCRIFNSGPVADLIEVPIFKLQGTNGVAFVQGKYFFVGPFTNAPLEGKVRIYNNGAVNYISSGTEDYCLSSNNFNGGSTAQIGVFTTDTSGVLDSNLAGGQVSFYLNFQKGNYPSALGENFLEHTWTCGDLANHPGPAAIANLIVIYYYYM